MTSTSEEDAPVGDGLFGLPEDLERSRVRVLPVPFDATASYRRGTSDAYRAIFEASSQVDLWDPETGEPWKQGIAIDPVNTEIAALNARCTQAVDDMRSEASLAPAARDALRQRVNDAGAAVNSHVHAWCSEMLEQDRIPAILGGDHSVPLGAIRAALAHHGALGVLHIDAHADLRCAYEGFEWSHASILYNVLGENAVTEIVQVGIRDQSAAERARALADTRVTQWLDADLAGSLAAGRPWSELVEHILAPLPAKIWLTFDIDGLDPCLCPATGTPVPGGLSWREATTLLAALGSSGRRIVGFDLCEVGAAEWDAIVGARLLYKLAGWALRTQAPTELPPRT